MQGAECGRSEKDMERRRTIRIRRSALTAAKLGDLDRPNIKIAETLDELTQTFRLIYAEYMEQGYIQAPHPEGLLYSIYNFLPKTCVFIFRSYLDVISTISYTPHTELFGLPMDSLYKDEIDVLRNQGRKVVEIGSLATERSKRGKNVVMYLYKTIINYALFTGVNDLCLMVNPKHVRFYSDIMLCEPLGEEKFYPSVGAPAVAMRVNMDEYEERLKLAYGDSEFETDLHAFFLKMNQSPVDQDIAALDGERNQALDYDAARYLFLRRPEVLGRLDSQQREYIERKYNKALYAPSSFN